MRKNGSIVWFLEPHSNVPKKGKIYDIFVHESIPEESYCIMEESTENNAVNRTFSECYDSKEECEKAIKARDLNAEKEYLSAINTKEELISFLYLHFCDKKLVNDLPAINAVKIKLKEFNLNL